MKSTQNIWLNEYEGLLPITVTDSEQNRSVLTSRTLPDYVTLSPHCTLTPISLEKATPPAFFE